LLFGIERQFALSGPGRQRGRDLDAVGAPSRELRDVLVIGLDSRRGLEGSDRGDLVVESYEFCARRHFGMARAESLLPDRQRTLVGRLGPGITAPGLCRARLTGCWG
jgi:hypothetical protein